MADILIVYGTTEGHTAAVVARMASALVAAGHTVEPVDAREVREREIGSGYAGILVGGSVHMGEYQSSVRDFVQRHRALLESTPSAFFSVSLSAAEADEHARQETMAVVEHFERETGWHPARVELIAGKLAYSQYNFFTRHVMQLIARQHGQTGDTSRDIVYTDWDAVERFAREFASSLGG